MGDSVDRLRGARFRTNNEDRSALVGKYYSGCLCWLISQMQVLKRSCLASTIFFAMWDDFVLQGLPVNEIGTPVTK